MQIRLATEVDAAEIGAIYGPVVASSPVSFEVEPPTVGEMADRIRTVLPDHPWIVVAEGESVLGYAYAHAFVPRAAYRWSVETSVYVAEASRGLGVGRALYGSLLEVLRCQGYRQALSGIALPNPASVALHESAGFLPIGVQRKVGWKLGAWHDVGWWQVELSNASEAPGSPAPVDELPGEVLRAALAAGLVRVKPPGT